MSKVLENLYGVILAGGSGTRLWPLSRKSRPKQFIDALDSGHTLFQMAAERVRPMIPLERMIVVTNQAFLKDIKAQMPDLPEKNIILEPVAKNTAPAMGVATALVKKRNPNGVIVNLASDHLILDNVAFRKTITAAAKTAADHQIVIIAGVKPYFANTGLGYIKIGTQEIKQDNKTIFNVEAFTEKPDEATAYAFISSGKYLWNANYYTYHVNTFMDNLQIHMPELYQLLTKFEDTKNRAEEQAVIEHIYKHAQEAPIDTEMTEKANNIHVIPADFKWSDIGNWGELYNVLATEKADKLKNVVISPNHKLILTKDTSGNLIYQSRIRPLGLIGIKDSIIVDLDDALLIASRPNIQEVKKLVEQMKDIDPSYL